MTLKQLKIRNTIFKGISLIFYLSILIGELYLFYHYTSPNGFWQWLGTIISFLFTLAITGVSLGIIEDKFGSKTSSFLTHPFYLGISKMTCHPKLGYFIMFFDEVDHKVEIKCFKQGFLTRRLIFETSINQDVKNLEASIVNRVKIELYDIYKDKLKQEAYRKNKEVINNKIKSTIENWDGYLDIQSRREEKINKIIDK